MVDAEWLLKSHRELLGVEKALQRRIKQLKSMDSRLFRRELRYSGRKSETARGK